MIFVTFLIFVRFVGEKGACYSRGKYTMRDATQIASCIVILQTE
jgi:hypothetical protein